ncbi:LOW QUALITY PROTEIN: centromere protein T [Microcaecilia unicolor]|uniref:Centromere protein T n=1 Tax=Microcaecilia unicolor TaxID=1415580 RepID=A0A6P7Y9M1_9AMPH|nr:LOW QUALITY PROTEIN: centromere protein T [Microcaecilia unicolor]
MLLMLFYGENMSVDSDDITARTLLKGFLAVEVPKSTVKRQSKRRASELERLYIENETSMFRNVKNINLLSPSMSLRGRMKEKIRRSIDKATGSGKRSFPDKGLPEKHLLGLGILPSEYDLDKDTPRTILKKIIQTENEVSMLVKERPKDGEHGQTQEPAVKTTHLGMHKLEMDVLQPPVHRAASGLSRTRKKKKRISVSQFERGVEEILPEIREREERLEDNSENIALANNSAMSRSLKTSFSIPSVPESIQKRGLVRRPKKHRIISVEDFEEGIKNHLKHLKSSQDCFVESTVTSIDGSMLHSNAAQMNTEIILSNTELFVMPQPKEQTLQELSQPRSLSLLSVSKQSLKNSSVHKRNVDSEGMARIDALEPEIGIQREVNSKKETAQLEGIEEENEEESSLNVNLEKSSLIEGMEEQNEEYYLVTDVENEVILMEEESNSPDTAENEVALTKGMAMDLKQMDRMIPTVKNGTECSVSFRNFRESLHGTEKLVDSVPPISAACMKESPCNLSRRSGHRSTQYSVKTSTTLVTSCAHSVGKGAISDQNNSVIHDKEEENYEKQVTKVEGAECEELSMDKNIFSRIKDIKFSPSLPTPHYLKTTYLKFPKKPPVAKRALVRASRALSRTKKEPTLPSRLVKQIFAHYANVSVAKDSFMIVEKCLDVYFKQLSNDLEAFAGHAKRKTVDATDIELLMRRQGLVTDKIPLHVLIERHLPLEYRKLLIPVAMSGNKVIQKK